MKSYNIPNVLPILPLPINQVLYPSLILSIQIARGDSVALLQSLLKNSAETSGNKPLIIGLAPLTKSSDGANGANGADSVNSLNKPEIEDIFDSRIIKLERLATGGFIAVCEGLERVHIDSFTQSGTPFFEANVTVLPTQTSHEEEKISTLTPILASVATSLLSTLALAAPLPTLLAKGLATYISELSPSTSASAVDILMGSIPISVTTGLTLEDKLSVLRAVDSGERLEKGIEIFTRIEQSLSIRKRIEHKVGETLSRRQRQYLLLQQLQAIKEELDDLASKDGLGSIKGSNKSEAGKKLREGEEGEGEDDIKVLEMKLKNKNWGNDELRRVAMKEFARLQKSPPQGAEYGVISNYLEWLLVLPWTDSTPLPLSREFLIAARRQLDADHFGLEQVKKRLIEWLAVLRLKEELWNAEASTVEVAADSPSNLAITLPSEAISTISLPSKKSRDNGPILLLYGPPGTGKTSIAKSLASALGRKFYRISLGGIRDAAEIRGHRRTYVSALPGRFAQALKDTGVNNPVILLDEIDKIGSSSTQGDPAAALLEVLDPEQNNQFGDHYLGVPLDLSRVLFIATANSLESIPAPLFDRMEPIGLSGYVHEEKLKIARRYLLPKGLESNSLLDSLVTISDAALMKIIVSYTPEEAGVRSLQRVIGAVLRSKAVEYSEARDKAAITLADRLQLSSGSIDIEQWGYKSEITLAELERILGPAKNDEFQESDRESIIGVSTGLAYRGSGNGGILHIESTSFPGNGALKLTGQLGEVISESAILAFAWVKSHAYELGIASSKEENIFKSIDIHIHLPSGSVKKDGPSAGVAMVVAIVSLLKGIQVLKGVAMTGEVTLRGKVQAVGGIKEKLLGAHRVGIRTIILPISNSQDVATDLPKSVAKDLKIIYVASIWEALCAAFGDDFGYYKSQGRISEVESRL